MCILFDLQCSTDFTEVKSQLVLQSTSGHKCFSTVLKPGDQVERAEVDFFSRMSYHLELIQRRDLLGWFP